MIVLQWLRAPIPCGVVLIVLLAVLGLVCKLQDSHKEEFEAMLAEVNDREIYG